MVLLRETKGGPSSQHGFELHDTAKSAKYEQGVCLARAKAIKETLDKRVSVRSGPFEDQIIFLDDEIICCIDEDPEMRGLWAASDLP